jgi:hypothetical protein
VIRHRVKVNPISGVEPLMLLAEEYVQRLADQIEAMIRRA